MSSYRQLDPQKIIETIDLLQRRVQERFPDAGLNRLVRELRQIASESVSRTVWIQKPNIALRFLGFLLSIGLLAILGRLLVNLSLPAVRNLPDFIQFLEASLSSSFFIGATIIFLVTCERRLKRARVLKALHELRSMAHIVDMHQLTKDPDRYFFGATTTPSSIAHRFTPFELGRYLDYCSESLALISKLAALYVQGFEDQVVLDAVDEIEALTAGLSRKIWQKITLLERLQEPDGGS